MVADSIEREIVIEAPAERVWALITEPQHIAGWFGDAGAEVDLRPGGIYRISWEAHGTTNGRVETVQPHTLFSYRWSALGDHWGEEPAEGSSTLVEFHLEPTATGTRVRVVESGFASLTTTEEQRGVAHEGNTSGWAAELGDLEAYAARVPA